MNNNDEYRGWFIDWIENWSQFIRHDNWNIFNFVQIEFEDDRCMGGIETTIMLLGVGFRLRWNYKETELSKEIDECLKEIFEES